MCVLLNDLHFLRHALCERPRPLSLTFVRQLPQRGSPWQKPETLPYCQGLSLWERWHGVSRDGEGKPASKRQIYEKALVFQGENLERREPVKFKLQGTRGTTLFAAPLGTAALHDRLFAANRCPCNGGHPSEPTCVFSPAAQGPVTEALCTRLAPPGGSLYAEEIRFFPVNAFVLFSKWTKFSMIRGQCQAIWLILKMKQFHKIRGRIFLNCARVDSMHFSVDSCQTNARGELRVYDRIKDRTEEVHPT